MTILNACVRACARREPEAVDISRRSAIVQLRVRWTPGCSKLLTMDAGLSRSALSTVIEDLWVDDNWGVIEIFR